jgi:hypothetical protein
VPARSNNLGGDRQPGNEGFDPGTDDDRRSLVDENDIDAAIGKHALCIFTATSDGLRPETQEMVRQRRRRRVLAIIRCFGFGTGGVIHRIATNQMYFSICRLDSWGLTAIAEVSLPSGDVAAEILESTARSKELREQVRIGQAKIHSRGQAFTAVTPLKSRRGSQQNKELPQCPIFPCSRHQGTSRS